MTANRELQERVLQALEFEPSVDAAKIGVTAHDGVITLQGSVPTFLEKWAAERAVGHVFGVRALANDLEVLPGHDGHRTDTAIAEAAANALSWDAAVPAASVQATVTNGWVALSGNVPWQYQRDAAERTVRRLYGVKGITNSIALKPQVHLSDIKAGIEAAFKRSAEIDAKNVHVDARDGQVFLTGAVHSWSERKQAERAAWSAAGVTKVEDHLLVTP
jgi:osmotically-inducible protein OsmY